MMFFKKKLHSPQDMAVGELSSLRSCHRKLVRQKSELDAQTLTQRKTLRSGIAGRAKNVVVSITKRVIISFERLAKVKIAKRSALRCFRIEHGLNREAALPKPMKTVFVAQACILVEGLITAGLMISDGKFDVMTAIVYGLSIAGINIAAGLMAGFFPARYAFYKVDAPEQKPRDFLIRNFARISLAGFIGAIGLLHYAAARVRATGSQNDIFNFTEISLWATFADYYALAILVIGVLGAILAVYEGFQGISDPVPSYSKTRKAAEQEIDELADMTQQDALNQLERAYSDACEFIESENDAAEAEITAYHNGLIKLNEQITAHNHSIDSAIDRLRAHQGQDLSNRRYMSQKQAQAKPIDYALFDCLRVEPVTNLNDLPSLASDGQVPAMLAELEEAYEAAVA